LPSLFNVAIEDVFSYEARNSMQTLVERVKISLVSSLVSSSPKGNQCNQVCSKWATRSQNSQVEQNICWLACCDPTTTSAHLLRANGVTLDIETNEHSFESRENPKESTE